MRSPPQPALQNVLVARPGNSPGTVARRDDLLAAAVLAAEDAHESRSRPRSVLARVTRRWSRLSGALRRRRKDEKRTRDTVAQQVVRLDHRGRVTLDAVPNDETERIQTVPSHVILHRERELRIAREGDSDMEAEAAVSSMREGSMRRVRQVGARDDDDTLLMLPRVAALSLTPPDSKKDSPRDGEGKRRQLPRVSALMPTRASNRPSSGLASPGLAVASPVSSASKTLSFEQDSDSDSNTSSDSDDYSDDDRYGTWDNTDGGKRAFYRLPTGLSNKDVEREIDRAVVEIASDDDSDGCDRPRTVTPPAHHVEIVKSRALSDTHQPAHPLRADVFAKRASSSIQAGRRVNGEHEGKARSSIGGETDRFRPSQEIALFEDDYLSFQGFHMKSPSDGRSQSTMASLLRSKRISSVTDSLSEESEEAANLRGTRSVDYRNRRERSGLLSAKMLRRRQVLTDMADVTEE